MFSLSIDAEAISTYAQERGVSRLVHFTPFLNLLGIFTTRAIMPKDSVVEYAKSHRDEDLLEYVTWNDSYRHDGRTNCINLSVQRINEPLFRSFKSKFSRGNPWCILEIDPVCLQKEGVLFAVSNAASAAVRNRGTAAGIAGLKAVFSEPVVTARGFVKREASMPRNWPTSVQAEVLFPGEIPLNLIRGLIFETSEGAARGQAMLSAEDMREPPEIKVVPADFGVIPKEVK